MRILEDIIKDEIRTAGPMTFERFMDLALYHGEYGYYGSGRARIGKAGDFYTSPGATPVFGKLVAEIYLSLKEASGLAEFEFVEMGAGEGHLAKDFLDSILRLHPREYEEAKYTIIEPFEGMRKRQREALAGHQGKVTWLRTLDELPDPVCGVFFSNELVDSFPFHLLDFYWEGMKEFYVSLERGELAWSRGPVSDPLIARYFNRLGLTLEPGTKTEVNLRACEWVRRLSEKLNKGFVITIDYGYSAFDYYSSLRKEGTLLCYYRHSTNDNPLELIGEQDITAHVDFTSLAVEGRDSGLEPILFTDQTSFLLEALGSISKALSEAGAPQEELEKTGLGLKTVLHPDWMGGAFMVLVQSKGLNVPGVFGKTRNLIGELGLPDQRVAL